MRGLKSSREVTLKLKSECQIFSLSETLAMMVASTSGGVRVCPRKTAVYSSPFPPTASSSILVQNFSAYFALAEIAGRLAPPPDQMRGGKYFCLFDF